MSAPDVSALVDIASSPESPSPTEPILDETTEVVAPETSAEGEGSPEAAPEEGKVDARTNPAAIRNALKSWRDSSPEHAPIARQLNDIVGRYGAYKEVFPKVAEAQQAKAVLEAVGGHEGITSLQDTLKSVSETDALLYAGDPRVIDRLLDDMRSEGKLDAFPKLAAPFLDKLREVNEKAYFETMRPHLVQGLEDSNFPGVLAAAQRALSGETPDINALKNIVNSMKEWFDGQKSQIKPSTARTGPDPEREAFERERTEFQTQKQKAFETEVHTDWNRENNRVLGTALKDYLKLPFAKNFTPATKVSIAKEVTSTLLAELGNDKVYQSQMDAMWNTKSPDKAKIISFHKAKVESIGSRIVREVMEARYPGFKSSGGAKPGAAKPGAKATVSGAQPTGKPIYTPQRPDWEAIDWSKDPQKMLYVSGRAYLKTGKFIAWSSKFKT